ncbi:MAG: thioredoxin [Bacteroidales bacterium]|nr:thioredoxin [Bacteroidales bacterium]MBP5725015.1 thioredoxin [Bacteroidales bacterium]
MALQITDTNYDQVVDTDKLVVIDFWAEWCGPCQKLSPIINELATEYEGKVVIGKCDVEENTVITSKFSVRNIPTLLFIKNKEVVDKLVGAVPTDRIREKIEANS